MPASRAPAGSICWRAHVERRTASAAAARAQPGRNQSATRGCRGQGGGTRSPMHDGTSCSERRRGVGRQRRRCPLGASGMDGAAGEHALRGAFAPDRARPLPNSDARHPATGLGNPEPLLIHLRARADPLLQLAVLSFALSQLLCFRNFHPAEFLASAIERKLPNVVLTARRSHVSVGLVLMGRHDGGSWLLTSGCRRIERY